MDRIAAGIALGVVLIVRGHRSPAPREVALSSEADQALKEVHLQEDAKSGSYRWSLDAERAESLPDSGKTSLWKVTIGVQDTERTWKVTSEEGDLIKETKDVELRGTGVLFSSEGLRVETSVLRWNNAEGRAWTDQPVTIYKGSGVVTGFGLETRPSDEVTLIRGRVKATFGGTKSSPESKAPQTLPARPAGKEASRSDAEPAGRRK